MKHLNKNQWIAVFAGLALLTYLLFADSLISFFNSSTRSTNTQMSENSLTVQEVAVGTGVVAEAGDVLTVHYVGTLTDGRVFDSSRDRNTPFDFTLGMDSVIRGWDEGLVGMRVGGKRMLVIPPSYGYGAQGVGTIPANSTLIFEVELLNVKKPSSR